MRIAYFTTTQDKQEYLNSPIESNPSNQVFHSNFIECLSLTNDVNVFVLRSNTYGNKESFVNKEGNVTWNYLQTKSGKFANLTSQISNSKKIKDKFDVAFVEHTDVFYIIPNHCKPFNTQTESQCRLVNS